MIISKKSSIPSKFLVLLSIQNVHIAHKGITCIHISNKTTCNTHFLHTQLGKVIKVCMPRKKKIKDTDILINKGKRTLTINTSNSSIARKGASVISWRAKAKHNVEKERSPPNSKLNYQPQENYSILKDFPSCKFNPKN